MGPGISARGTRRDGSKLMVWMALDEAVVFEKGPRLEVDVLTCEDDLLTRIVCCRTAKVRPGVLYYKLYWYGSYLLSDIYFLRHMLTDTFQGGRSLTGCSSSGLVPHTSRPRRSRLLSRTQNLARMLVATREQCVHWRRLRQTKAKLF